MDAHTQSVRLGHPPPVSSPHCRCIPRRWAREEGHSKPSPPRLEFEASHSRCWRILLPSKSSHLRTCGRTINQRTRARCCHDPILTQPETRVQDRDPAPYLEIGPVRMLARTGHHVSCASRQLCSSYHRALPRPPHAIPQHQR